jgi:two-component system nitrogen regulation response regulator NtrX
MALNVLVIDDEEDIRSLISDILIDAKFSVRTAANSSKAFELINEKAPSAIILDIWLHNSELDGLGILEIIKKKYPLLPIIVISGHGTIATAVTAIKMGAFDYIEKPFSQEKLLIVLKRACETAKLKKNDISPCNHELLSPSYIVLRRRRRREGYTIFLVPINVNRVSFFPRG